MQRFIGKIQISQFSYCRYSSHVEGMLVKKKVKPINKYLRPYITYNPNYYEQYKADYQSLFTEKYLRHRHYFKVIILQGKNDFWGDGNTFYKTLRKIQLLYISTSVRINGTTLLRVNNGEW